MAQFAEVQSISVGNFKITFLADGGGYLKPEALYPTSGAQAWSEYGQFINEKGYVVISIGGFLIETADQKIVMDLGFGPASVEFPGFGPFIGGKFLDSLQQVGVSRTAVTDVIFTHLHLDHVGWTTLEINGRRELLFPEARYLCSQPEWEFWQNDQSGLGPHAQHTIAPLDNIIQFVKGGDEIAPGVTVVSTPGHTPGHISLQLEAGNQEVYLISDLLYSEVQFYEAGWHVAFDVDPMQGRKTRENIYALLAKPHIIVANGHFADTVFGRLTQQDGRWLWQPLE